MLEYALLYFFTANVTVLCLLTLSTPINKARLKKINSNQSYKLFYGTNCSLNVEIALTELLVTKLILYLVIMLVFSTFYTLFAKEKL